MALLQLSVAYPEGFPEHIHNSFSPYMALATPYMVKMSCEYAQETPLDTPLAVMGGIGPLLGIDDE